MNMDKDKTLGENIRYYRIKNKINQIMLAEKIDVSPTSVRKYESGDRTPTLSTLSRIAEAFNVSTEELLKSKSSTINRWPNSTKCTNTELKFDATDYIDSVIQLLNDVSLKRNLEYNVCELDKDTVTNIACDIYKIVKLRVIESKYTKIIGDNNE